MEGIKCIPQQVQSLRRNGSKNGMDDSHPNTIFKPGVIDREGRSSSPLKRRTNIRVPSTEFSSLPGALTPCSPLPGFLSKNLDVPVPLNSANQTPAKQPVVRSSLNPHANSFVPGAPFHSCIG